MAPPKELSADAPSHLPNPFRSDPPDGQAESSSSHNQQQEQPSEQQQHQQERRQQQEDEEEEEEEEKYISPQPHQPLILTEASLLQPQQIEPAAVTDPTTEAALREWQDIDQEIESHPQAARTRILEIIANRPKTPSKIKQARMKREQQLLQQGQQQEQPQQEQQQHGQPATPTQIHKAPEDQFAALSRTKSKGKGKAKAKAGTIRIPKAPSNIEAFWASLYLDNVKLRQHIREHEHNLNDTTIKLDTAREELRVLKRQAAAANPLISNLETALVNNESQLSLLQDVADNTCVRTLSAGSERLAAQREVVHLRRLNNSLMNNISTDRGKIAKLEAQIERMKEEMSDDLIEVRMRNAVLEAENAHLRRDIATGMEYMQHLVKGQWEMSIELNMEDKERNAIKRVEDELEEEEGENLDKLGIQFRGDSIWEGCEAGPQNETVPVAVDEADVGVSSAVHQWAPPQLRSSATPLSSPAAAAPVRATIPRTTTVATQTSPISHNVAPLPKTTPATKTITHGPSMGTPTSPISPTVAVFPELSRDHPPAGTKTRTTGPSTGTQTSPISPVTIFLPEPPSQDPHLATAATAKTAKTSGPLTGTQTEPDILNNKATHSTPRTFILPHLLFLISAFLLAYHAENFAVQQEIWATANDAVRETVVSWNAERWSGVLVETLSWELERWSGVERALIG